MLLRLISAVSTGMLLRLISAECCCWKIPKLTEKCHDFLKRGFDRLIAPESVGDSSSAMNTLSKVVMG